MANDLLGIGLSGLRVSQSAISTVGHNIANAGTEGYSRQRVDTVTNPAMLGSGGYIGNGANVNSVDRIVNQFVIGQLRTDTTLFADLDKYYAHLSQLDNLLSDESTGLTSSLNSFFSAVQNGADDPTSIPARQLVISEAQNLADRFNTLYSRMQVMDESVDSGLEVSISQVNALSNSIAQLNAKIADAVGVGNGAAPNDLLDQRDDAIKSLAALVPVQVFDQGNGQLNVMIGTGQSLVIGPNARQLELAPSAQTAEKLSVYFTDGNSKQDITSFISGGEIGGLLRFRDEVLDNAYNNLGRIAVVMADSFNRAHQQGVDLQDEFGQFFFYDVNDEDVAQSRVIGDANNAKPDDRELSLYIQDSANIKTSDYRVEIDNGGVYRVTRLNDQKEVSTGLIPGSFPFSIEFDGLQLEFESGSFRGGDEFLLQPTRFGARDFDSALVGAEDLAFASPVLTDASLGNIGSGVISAGEVVALEDIEGNPLPLFAEPGSMSPPLIVVFNTPYSYDVLDNSDPSNPTHLEPPIRNQRYVPGVTNNLFPSQPGGTLVSTNGEMMGLPGGREPVVGGVGLVNGYPSESITITRPATTEGGAPVTTTVITEQNATAREIASQLSGVQGVEANAYNYAELSNLQLTRSEPLQITVNGQALLEYTTDPITGNPVLSDDVPDPVADEAGFYQYLSERINESDYFKQNKMYAVAGEDSLSGTSELRLFSAEGDDFNISLAAGAGESMQVSDGDNSPVTIDGLGTTVASHIMVGGRLDVSMDDGVSLSTYSSTSMLFGDTQASDFAQSSYLGIQASITGNPSGGDSFTLNFNEDAASDNRNALNLVNLQNMKSAVGGSKTFSQTYGSLVEQVGIETSSARINRDAAEKVLTQTENLRNSISGVNLDEEAADLIRFEQLFSANTQVISVARDIFDRLLSAF